MREAGGGRRIVGWVEEGKRDLEEGGVEEYGCYGGGVVEEEGDGDGGRWMRSWGCEFLSCSTLEGEEGLPWCSFDSASRS